MSQSYPLFLIQNIDWVSSSQLYINNLESRNGNVIGPRFPLNELITLPLLDSKLLYTGSPVLTCILAILFFLNLWTGVYI